MEPKSTPDPSKKDEVQTEQPDDAFPPAEPTPTPPEETQPPAPTPKSEPAVQKTKPKLAKMIVIGLVALLVLGGSGFGIFKLTGSLGGGINLVEYTNSDLGFSLSHPEGWDEEKTSSTGIAIYQSDEQDTEGPDADYKALITVDIFPELVDQFSEEDAFFEGVEESYERIRRLEESFEGTDELWKEHVSQNYTEVSGYKTLLIEENIHNVDDDKSESGKTATAIIFIDSDIQASITMTAHESDLEYYDIFDQILDSFNYEG